MSATRPPLAYLVTCSQMSLESVELSRLNRAANLRKEFHQILEEWIDSEVDARLARSILEWKRQRESDFGAALPQSAECPHYQQLAIAFLPESTAPDTFAAPECNAQSPQTDVRTNGAGPTQRVQPQERIPSSDHAMTPSRSTQRAMAAEARLREVEHFAECFAARLREHRGKCATHNADALSCPEPAARPRKECAGASRKMWEHAAPTIEGVPLCAKRDEPEAPSPEPIRAEDSLARRIRPAKLDKPQPNTTRPGDPTPRAIHLPAKCSGVHFRVRQAV